MKPAKPVRRKGQTRATSVLPSKAGTGGRPSIRTPENATMICEGLRKGLSLNAMDKLPGYPSQYAVYDWLHADPVFAKAYAGAYEIYVDYFEDRLLAAATDGSNDTYTDEDGQTKVDHDVIARSKLVVDTMKWILCKRRPGIYGDKEQSINVTNVVITAADAEARVRRCLPVIEEQAGWQRGSALRDAE